MAEHPDPLIAHFLSLGLIDEEDIALVQSLLEDARGTLGVPFDEHDLVGVSQALGRAAERVAAASADIVVRRLDELPAGQRDGALDDWLRSVMQTATTAFGVLYAHRLQRIAHRRLAASRETNHPSPPLAVGFVDLRGSTAFMIEGSPEEIEALIDELYAVGQAVASRNEVAAGKFLGDGVLLVSADPDRLLHATAESVVELGRRTPLRAGAGIARGPVIRRAGDWHGTPVNLAARLAELAGADEILLDAGATDAHTVIDHWREVMPRGLPHMRPVAVVLPS
ncbi:MAG: adenylate/guanylate cyclase [Solirubrobacterales bacterium]|nr:adenylate/guanylate cyclase [Solirubrobacterales bacterium]